jgi:hypothetical protein
MANADGDEQLKAPAETGEREMNSKRRATAEEEEVAVVEAAMIEKERIGLQTRTLPSTEVKWNNEASFKRRRDGNGVGGGTICVGELILLMTSHIDPIKDLYLLSKYVYLADHGTFSVRGTIRPTQNENTHHPKDLHALLSLFPTCTFIIQTSL